MKGWQFGESSDMLIAHTRFMNNMYMYSEYLATIVHVSDANLVITHSTFTNNAGNVTVLGVGNTDMNISHSEFICNQATIYDLAFLYKIFNMIFFYHSQYFYSILLQDHAIYSRCFKIRYSPDR